MPAGCEHPILAERTGLSTALPGGSPRRGHGGARPAAGARGTTARRYSIRSQVCVLQMNQTQPLTSRVLASISSISAS